MFYSALTKNPLNRLFIGVTIFLAGLRISLLSPNLVSPFYFGSILIHLSVFASYISFNNSLSLLPIFSLMLLIIMVQASLIKSSFLMLMTIVNFSGFVATKLTSKGSDTIKLFVVFIIVNVCITIVCGFSLSFYYKIIQFIIRYAIPKNLQYMLYAIFDENFLPETLLAKYVINFFICKAN